MRKILWVLKRRNLGGLSVLHIRQDSTERDAFYILQIYLLICVSVHIDFFRRSDCFLEVKSEMVGVGRVGGESKLQMPMPYPTRWDRTSALPQYSHCSTPVCPRMAWVPGPPVLPHAAQDSAVCTQPVRCHTVGQSQGLGWSWPSPAGLD